MPKYRLVYFNGRGLAEISRLILVAAGVEYEDVRLTQEQWEKEKGKYIFAQLPALEIEGAGVLLESKAIARYLANEHGLAGKSSMDKAKVDMVADCLDDALRIAVHVYMEKDAERKDKLRKELAEKLDAKLASLEKFFTTNNGGNGYLVGDELTWADLNFTAQMDYMMKYQASVIDKYPKLKALRERVVALPKVAAWLKKRPETDF
ncbi:S-crystallin SL11-like [Ptychodera flava]|uniref:S-crystallin SL11-like n=1 Tax=Ptychodera flava TaxID=63121 RepID=UPI00396A3628